MLSERGIFCRVINYFSRSTQQIQFPACTSENICVAMKLGDNNYFFLSRADDEAISSMLFNQIN